jgi:hypothetical protein
MKIGYAAQPVLTVRDSLVLTLEAPAETEVDATVVPFENRADVKAAFVQARGRTFEIRAVLPGAGVYEIAVTARKQGETSKESHRVISYRVEAKGGASADYFPTLFPQARERDAYLYYPLTKRVGASKPQGFVLSVPEAVKVVVISGEKKLLLQKCGDLFVGEVSLMPGETRVAAFFPNNLKTGPVLYKFVAE